MRRTELDSILADMLETHDGISDLNFTVGRPFQVEAFGQLIPASIQPRLSGLSPYQTEQIAMQLIGGDTRLLRDL